MLFWFHIMNLLPQNLQNGTASLSAAFPKHSALPLPLSAVVREIPLIQMHFRDTLPFMNAEICCLTTPVKASETTPMHWKVSPSAAIWTVIFSTHASVFLRHSRLILSSPKIPAKRDYCGKLTMIRSFLYNSRKPNNTFPLCSSFRWKVWSLASPTPVCIVWFWVFRVVWTLPLHCLSAIRH